MAVDFYNLYFVLQLYFFLDRVYGFGITQLKVPALVDPRDSLTLSCTYDMGSEELYSVKWYKDEQEFFRYTPRQQPHVMSFPVAGVHLAQPQLPVQCDVQQCTVELTRLSTAHSGGAYKCEVSTEAPKFRRDIRVSNITVAAIGRTAPEIQGLRATYTVAELIHAQCTAAAADPQPSLTWLLNGSPAPAAAVGPQRASPPDRHGLATASRELRFTAERQHFPPPGRQLSVVCVAEPPAGVPGAVLTSQAAVARLLESGKQQRNVMGNQKLEWINGTASVQRIHQGILFTVVLVIFCWQ